MNVSESRDFPDWLGPMLVKELRQGLKARAFELSFIALQITLVLVLSYHALLYARYGSGFNPEGLNGFFWLIVSVQLLIIAPLRALGSLTNERKANTLELIFMTGLSSWRIAWGKWASLFFQSILFVLAVLPYGVLRYFFGGVNLIDDLITLGGILLVSGVLCAVALAISGLPTFTRIGAIGAFALFGVSFLPAMVFRTFMRAPSMGLSSGPDATAVWLIGIFNSLLICFGALELGAASIAPIAENHALRQRLIVLSAWLPIPVLKLLGGEESFTIGQLIFCGVLCLAVSWIHLGVTPPTMRVHLDAFSRRGPFGLGTGCLLQPGWPSAVVFLTLVEFLLAVTANSVFREKREVIQFITVAMMAGATLLTGPLIWRLLRIKARYPVVHHTLFICACGGLALFIKVITDDASHLGDAPVSALLPPFGLFAMMDGGIEDLRKQWFGAGVITFTICATSLLLLSREYWLRMLNFARDIRQRVKPARATQEVAA